jgi:hypothetical protein
MTNSVKVPGAFTKILQVISQIHVTIVASWANLLSDGAGTRLEAVLWAARETKTNKKYPRLT